MRWEAYPCGDNEQAEKRVGGHKYPCGRVIVKKPLQPVLNKTALVLLASGLAPQPHFKVGEGTD